MIAITLPDGSRREFPGPVTVAEVAQSIGAGLAKAALAGRVDGQMVDTSYTIDRDAKLAIITDKDADGVDVIRHSTAHLLAYAVKELYPEAQVTIGPVIDNGFYYDFAYKRPFTPEDLVAIEKKMTELAKKDEKVTREVWNRDEAVKLFQSMGEKYKAEIIASIPEDQEIGLYREGNFVDLCRRARRRHDGAVEHAAEERADGGDRDRQARRPVARLAEHRVALSGQPSCAHESACVVQRDGAGRDARPGPRAHRQDAAA